MAFTNVWDVTQPPDTQQANLLGLDLRNLKLDIQQRMGGFASGILANRPDPSTDAQPTNWTGVMYFATDTGQIFQWSGSAWVEITGSFSLKGAAYKQSTVTMHTGTTSKDTIYSITIPSGVITPTSQFRITVPFMVTAFVTGGTLFVSFGGQGLGLTNSFSLVEVGVGQYYLEHFGLNSSALTQNWFQKTAGAFSSVTPVGVDRLFNTSSSPVPTTVNTANAVTILLQFQNGSTGDKQTFYGMAVEIL